MKSRSCRDRRDGNHHGGRQAGAGAAAEHRDLRRQQAKHLGHDPGADREIMAAQPEHQARRPGSRRAAAIDAGERDRPQRRNPGKDGEREQHIGAEPDIGLLADRDETGIAGEQIPQARQRDIGVDFRQAAADRRGRPRTAPPPAPRAQPRRAPCRCGSTGWRRRRARSRAHRCAPLMCAPWETGPAGAPRARPERRCGRRGFASPDRDARRSLARRRGSVRRRACPTGCRGRR